MIGRPAHDHGDLQRQPPELPGQFCAAHPTDVTPATTTTDLASSLNPVVRRPAVTFTATVTSWRGPVSAGTVTFTGGGAPVALNAQGQATFTTSALAAGTHTITATYNGTTEFNGSSDSVSQVVNNAQTTTVLAARPQPVAVRSGGDVHRDRTISTGPDTGTAGTVTFTDDDDRATTLAANVALNAAA